MTKYLGVKLISAMALTWGEYQKLPERTGPVGTVASTPDDAPGYLVQYPDGYKSWSPAAAFDAAYRPTDGLSFGLGVEAMKLGHRVARSGWNGKGMFVALQGGSQIGTHGARGGAAKHLADMSPADAVITICPHIDMKAADGSIVIGWLASQTDMLADDWQILE